MSGHTQEPWNADGGYISGVDGFCVANTLEDAGDNARRIVACVNAFAEFHDTEIIEDMLAGGFSVRGLDKYAKGLEQQRDELLELVKQSYRKQNAEYLELLSKYAGTRFEHDPAIVRAKGWVKKADELIAKAETR